MKQSFVAAERLWWVNPVGNVCRNVRPPESSSSVGAACLTNRSSTTVGPLLRSLGGGETAYLNNLVKAQNTPNIKNGRTLIPTMTRNNVIKDFSSQREPSQPNPDGQIWFWRWRIAY